MIVNVATMSLVCLDIVRLIDRTKMGHSWDITKNIMTKLSQSQQYICNTLIHRGKILEETLRKQNVVLTKLADKLPWSTKTIYRHFEEQDLSYEKIGEYARASKYPFTDEFPELEKYNYRSIQDIPNYSQSTDPEFYRLKYENLLEKYNGLLEKYSDLIMGQLKTQT